MNPPPVIELPAHGARVTLVSADGNLGHGDVRRCLDDLPIGSFQFEAHGPTLFVQRLCIDADYRGYGAGTEAAHLLTDAASHAGFAAIRAWAPPDIGLAVYFWFRMGLRPLHGPGPNGGILLERLLTPSSLSATLPPART